MKYLNIEFTKSCTSFTVPVYQIINTYQWMMADCKKQLFVIQRYKFKSWSRKSIYSKPVVLFFSFLRCFEVLLTLLLRCCVVPLFLCSVVYSQVGEQEQQWTVEQTEFIVSGGIVQGLCMLWVDLVAEWAVR